MHIRSWVEPPDSAVISMRPRRRHQARSTMWADVQTGGLLVGEAPIVVNELNHRGADRRAKDRGGSVHRTVRGTAKGVVTDVAGHQGALPSFLGGSNLPTCTSAKRRQPAGASVIPIAPGAFRDVVCGRSGWRKLQ